MINKILIIGCGLIGSSILRAVSKKRIAKKIFIFEKSSSNISKIKKIKVPLKITKDLKKIVPEVDMIILCTPMSEYERIILKINKYIKGKTLITDVGSTKEKSLFLIKKKLKKKYFLDFQPSNCRCRNERT